MNSKPATDIEYANHADQLLETLKQKLLNGDDIPMAMCISGLEPNRRHQKLRDFVTKTLKMRGSEFDQAIQREEVTYLLGGIYPTSPRHFVDIMAKSMNMTARYNGLLHRNEQPYIIVNGKRSKISPDDYGLYENKMLVRKFQRDYQYDRFLLDVRCAACEYKLPFHANDLNDAGDKWYHEVCEERLGEITRSIDYTDSHAIRERGQTAMQLLASTSFDCDQGSEFVVAVLQKFIWQVKRKIAGLPIYDHLMPVILGGQGIGKSTLIRKLLEPVEELRAMTDFKQITDDRNISLWRNYVIFLDEMGWASKSDMDTVKNILTASSLTRRVMRTNITQEVAMNATFIGAANAADLSDLIRDETGTRRFVSLNMKATPDRELINDIDWSAVWRSVNENADDPMSAFRSQLQVVQAKERTKSTVEHWLEQVTPQVYAKRGKMPASELFLDYTQYEMANFPGLRNRMSGITFAKQMTKLSDQPDCPFTKSVSHSQAMYQVSSSHPNLRLITE